MLIAIGSTQEHFTITAWIGTWEEGGCALTLEHGGVHKQTTKLEWCCRCLLKMTGRMLGVALLEGTTNPLLKAVKAL
jgi:hypothetical protein